MDTKLKLNASECLPHNLRGVDLLENLDEKSNGTIPMLTVTFYSPDNAICRVVWAIESKGVEENRELYDIVP